MISGKVLGTGSYLPKKTVTNEDLEKIVDTSDEWIYTRTGIKQRRIADQETNYEMAIQAAKEALDSAQVQAEDIELIIVATTSSEYAFPSMSCLVQKGIGAKDAMCFDISAACSGFVFAIHTANQFIKNGQYKKSLIIGSEKLSHLVNWEDRATCVLFGDGAGAIVLGASEELGVIGSICKSRGEDSAYLTAGIVRQKTPFYEPEKDEPFIKMEGREVHEFATRTVPAVIEELLEQNNLIKDEIGYYVLHQANQRIINSVAKKLGQDISKFYSNIEFYGNTSAASITIALDELYKAGKLEGQKVVIAGFGAGLTYGASVIQF